MWTCVELSLLLSDGDELLTDRVLEEVWYEQSCCKGSVSCLIKDGLKGILVKASSLATDAAS